MKNKTTDWQWADLKKELNDKNFVTNIVNFNTDSLKPNVRSHVDSTYL